MHSTSDNVGNGLCRTTVQGAVIVPLSRDCYTLWRPLTDIMTYTSTDAVSQTEALGSEQVVNFRDELGFGVIGFGMHGGNQVGHQGIAEAIRKKIIGARDDGNFGYK